MCLAIYKPAGKLVKEEYLRNGFANHSDGAGMAWSKDGVLHFKKGIFKLEEFLELYEQIKELPALLHFRKATHGAVNEANCHPFIFNDGKLALIHNGVLNIKCNIEGLSDTAHFVKLVLEPMINKNNVPIDDGALHYLISTSIGTDKMVVMDGNGAAYVFNEDKGTLDEGVWYSNTTFRYSNKSHTSSYKTSTHCGNGCSQQSHREYDLRGPVTDHNPNAVNGDHGGNWRKNWAGSTDDDEAYISFWKRVGVMADTTVVSARERLQASRKLLTAGSTDNTTDTAIIDAEEVDSTVDAAGNVITQPASMEGQMCEYGWWDVEIEKEIDFLTNKYGLNREEAIIRVFNEK